MLQLTPQNVGTAPGTTTFTIPQQPQMSPTRRSLDGALGTVYPTDFDLSRMYGYLPYNSGWISGKLIQPGLRGDEAAAMLAPEQQVVALQAKMAALEVAAKEEEVKTSRSMRTWTIVAGLVGVAGLVVSVYALKQGR
jgi:hypothetical protein